MLERSGRCAAGVGEHCYHWLSDLIRIHDRHDILRARF